MELKFYDSDGKPAIPQIDHEALVGESELPPGVREWEFKGTYTMHPKTYNVSFPLRIRSRWRLRLILALTRVIRWIGR